VGLRLDVPAWTERWDRNGTEGLRNQRAPVGLARPQADVAAPEGQAARSGAAAGGGARQARESRQIEKL